MWRHILPLVWAFCKRVLLRLKGRGKQRSIEPIFSKLEFPASQGNSAVEGLFLTVFQFFKRFLGFTTAINLSANSEIGVWTKIDEANENRLAVVFVLHMLQSSWMTHLNDYDKNFQNQIPVVHRNRFVKILARIIVCQPLESSAAPASSRLRACEIRSLRLLPHAQRARSITWYYFIYRVL